MLGERFKRGVIPYVLSKCSVRSLTRLTGTTLVSVYYHQVSDVEAAHTKHLHPHKNPGQFREDLDYLARAYNIVSLSDVLEARAEAGRPLPERALLITFDDGFRESYDVAAPILLQKGIPAAFFICSGCIDNKILCYAHKASVIAEALLRHRAAGVAAAGVALGLQGASREGVAAAVLSLGYAERPVIDLIAQRLEIDLDEYREKQRPYLTADQIGSLLKDGFAIGAHSIDHPIYAGLPPEEQRVQTLASVEEIRRRFSLAYGAFAFPSTDAGVKRSHFEEVERSGLVDLWFGTGSMMRDDIASLLHRCSLERPVMPAERILAMEYARKLYRMAAGRDTVRRAA